VLLRLSSDFRRAMDLSLVLDQEGIPHEVRRLGDALWGLEIDDQDAARAAAAVAAFEQENPPEVRRRQEVHSATEAVASGVAFALALLAVYIRTGPESAGSPWFERGSADAAAILRGEWWRAVTALTLHSDAGHVAGNAVLGGLLLALLARSVGPGMASALMLLSGAAGTFACPSAPRRRSSVCWARWQHCRGTVAGSGCPSLAGWRCLDSWERRRAPTSPGTSADSCPECWRARGSRSCHHCGTGWPRRAWRSLPRASR